MPKNFNQDLKYRKEGYQCQEIPFEVTGVKRCVQGHSLDLQI